MFFLVSFLSYVYNITEVATSREVNLRCLYIFFVSQFSDLILYSNRSGHTFRVHGQLPLNNVMIEERPDTPQQHSFSIYGGNRVITVAASSEDEKDKWLEDLTAAIQKCKTNRKANGIDSNSLYYFSLKSCSE